jgi:hypothetical protein
MKIWRMPRGNWDRHPQQHVLVSDPLTILKFESGLLARHVTFLLSGMGTTSDAIRNVRIFLSIAGASPNFTPNYKLKHTSYFIYSLYGFYMMWQKYT